MKKITLGFLLLFSCFLQAQFQLNTPVADSPSNAVNNYLLGTGVSAFNTKFNNSTNPNAINDQCGFWSIGANPVNFGFTPGQKGMLLTTGKNSVAQGPNNSPSASALTTTPVTGDSDLSLLSLGTVKNVAVLEFDFVATGPKLTFDYVFGSEEYPEYAFSAYNDVFGFFLSGPGISGGFTNDAENIAVLPTTATKTNAVSINNVNQSTNSAYYISNPPSSSDTQYDGFTTVLQATHELKCGQTYHLKIAIANVADNAWDSGVFLRNCTIEQEACIDKIRMVAFVDDNNNGLRDNNETYFNNGNFVYQQNNAGDIYTVSSPSGIYEITDNNPENIYDFSYQINAEYASIYSAITTFNDINIPTGSGFTTYYLPIKLINGYNDVVVSIIPESQPRPGFTYINRIVYKNLGNTAASGTLTFTKPAPTTIDYISQSGVVNTTDGFTFNYNNLAPNETRTILVRLSVPTIPTVKIGDLLTDSVNITAPTNDINLNNNSFTNNQTIVGSYDPNDITEAHGDKIVFDNFSSNDYLTYTIRFQNTGTASADRVKIEEVLDTKLDAQSIRMVSASHNYTMERVNNNVYWMFESIDLVPKMQSETLSSGFVTFQIKLKPGFEIGDIIPNTANIHFDFNPAIETNTFNTEFVSQLKNTAFTIDNIQLYPNPASNQIQINLTKSTETLSNITIYDVLGHCVKRTGSQSSIDVSDLAKGIYLIEMTTESQLKLTKKLVIE